MRLAAYAQTTMRGALMKVAGSNVPCFHSQRLYYDFLLCKINKVTPRTYSTVE